MLHWFAMALFNAGFNLAWGVFWFVMAGGAAQRLSYGEVTIPYRRDLSLRAAILVFVAGAGIGLWSLLQFYRYVA